MIGVQLFRPLPRDIEDALRASIQRFGVLVPVVKDQDGRILDGHHRSRLAEEIGVEYRVDVRRVADEVEAREVARTLNADRRHLTAEQRKEVVAVLAAETVTVGREEVAKHSERAIAGALGVSRKTVQDDIAELATSSQLPRPAKTLGQDRKVRSKKTDAKPAAVKAPGAARPKPNRRPLPTFAKDAGWALRREVEKIERILADDRFTQNKEQVTAHLHGHLTYAVEALRRALDSLDLTKETTNGEGSHA